MSTRIIVGHVIDRLRDLPDQSVHCICTSPPYFGLREYGTPPQVWGGAADCEHQWSSEMPGRRRDTQRLDELGAKLGTGGGHKASGANHTQATAGCWCEWCGAWRGELGQEPTLALYVEHIVDVFREAKRVLRDDGTLWLNIGDSYAGSWGAQSHREAPATLSRNQISNHPKRASHTGAIRDAGLKPKDLMMVLARVAIALCDDGWYLRKQIIWSKNNCMPESATDRPTSSHEYIYLLSKRSTYYYDAEAVRETTTGNAHPRGDGVGKKAHLSSVSGWDTSTGNGRHGSVHRNPRRKANPSFLAATAEVVSSRNMRDVWTIPTTPYKAAHFATFPVEIPRRCILAGTSERGCCPTCGAPWRRVVEKIDTGKTHKMADGWDTGPGGHGSFHRNGRGRGDRGVPVMANQTTGWAPSCKCAAGDPVPCVVLDLFAGSGTTMLVADRLGRHGWGIDLNGEYIDLAVERVTNDAPLFTRVAVEHAQTVPMFGQENRP